MFGKINRSLTISTIKGVDTITYIAYSRSKNNHAIYTTVFERIREGNKVKRQRIENHGQVSDPEKRILKNRTLKLFCYTLEDGFPYADIPGPDSTLPTQETLILDFRAAFC